MNHRKRSCKHAGRQAGAVCQMDDTMVIRGSRDARIKTGVTNNPGSFFVRTVAASRGAGRPAALPATVVSASDRLVNRGDRDLN